MRLRGRADECRALEALVRDIENGRSRVLVLRGEAGIGTSTLLGYVADRMRGWQISDAVGSESEMALAYSGLQRLCAPLLGHLGALPAPQRAALGTAFGLSEGAPPNRFLVGLAALSLLAEAAERGPVAWIVDDGQWLDTASRDALHFIGRRLVGGHVARRSVMERVAIVCALRTGPEGEELADLPELRVAALDDASARALLSETLHGPMDTRVFDRIISEARGNPLAILELPRAWNPDDVAGGYGWPDLRRVPTKIERSYARRWEALSQASRLLALLAAAEPMGDPTLLAHAAALMGLDLAAAASAETAGLFRIGARVEFAHPLARSAVYATADTTNRLRAHRALAEVTDAATDPDRRVWHLARATIGPDEGIAAELEHSADRARARGGEAAAAAFLGQAVEHSADPRQRVRRSMAAAAAYVAAGSSESARRFIDIAGDGPAEHVDPVRVGRLHGLLAWTSRNYRDAPALLLSAARRLEDDDPRLARDTYVTAFITAFLAGRLSDDVDAFDVATAANALACRPVAHATSADLLLRACGALCVDVVRGAAAGRTALRNVCDDDGEAADDPRNLFLAVLVALALWDDGSLDELTQRCLVAAREVGALSELEVALNVRAVMLTWFGRGDTPELASAIAEGISIKTASGLTTPPFAEMIHAAWQGEDAAAARVLIEENLRDGRSRNQGSRISVSHYAAAVLANSLGDYDEAFAAAVIAAADPAELPCHSWALPELVEAAVRTGRPAAAVEAADRVVAKATATGNAWARGLAARARALTCDDAAAEAHYRASIDHLEHTDVRAELARSHLLYGEWLRRAGRRRDARAQLRIAYDQFTVMGMVAFAQRTGRELAATGASTHKGAAGAPQELTAQELLIATLAQRGYSNAEIGVQLFLSARTIEWHLGKVFAKLGIASRRQLRQLRLSGVPPADPAAGRTTSIPTMQP